MDEIEKLLDFDKLNYLEREYYLKSLNQVADAEITLEDWRKYITHMREAIENTLVTEPEYIYSEWLPFLKRSNPKYREAIIRLKNYLIFERFFMKKSQAKKALEVYNKKLGVK